MAEEIHQHEVVFLLELLEITTERVNLTGSASDKILLLAVDSLEAVNRIALIYFEPMDGISSSTVVAI